MHFVVFFISVGLLTFSAETGEVPTLKCPPVKDDNSPVYLPDKDCTKYWQCTSNNKAHLLECPYGLHFSNNSNNCDLPAVAECATKNTETNELCPETIANECPAADGELPVYIPLPDCSQFCLCSKGLPWLHNCPGGLEFSPILNVCDWPGNAGCSDENRIDSATTTDSNNDTASQTSTTTESGGGNGNDSITTTDRGVSTTDNGGTNQLCSKNVAKECPAVNGEYPVYIPLPDCTQFCQCSNGLPWLHNCPDGLEFNPVLNVCDWPENAGCSSGNGTDSATTTDSNNDTETQTSSTTEDGGGNGSDTPTTTDSVVSTTDSGGTNERCPKNVAKECPAVDGEYPVYIPLPDCTQFCQCSNGLPWLHNCPDGLEFNPVLNVCDWPENAGCSSGNGTDSATTTDSTDDTATQTSSTTEDGGGNGSDIPTTTESVVPTTDNGGTNERCPENVAKECPAVDGEYPVYIPLPDCTKFCQCSNGLPWLHNCPDGLEFNPVLNVCDWPENAGCSSVNGTDSATTTDSNDDTATQTSSTTEDSGGNGSDTPTTTESIVSTTDNGGTNERCPENVAKECPAVDGEYPVYIPLPDCTQFCQCSNGLPWLHNCPDGLEFNPVLNVCDWPENAGCSSGNGTDSATTTDSNDDTATQTSSTTEDGGGNGSDTPTTTESVVSTTDNGGTNERCPENVTKECPAVDGEYPVYIPLPDCTKFCQCSNGLPWLHNCPDGLEFNPVLNVCDWPENAGCSSGNGTDSATTTDSNDDTATQTSSTTEDGGGNGSDTPTTTESVVSTTDNGGTNERCPENVAKECPAVDGEYPVYIPLPDCTKFCQCSNGLPWLHNCPDGLEFNPVLNVCDWPENAGCSSGNGTDSATTTDSNDDTATQTSSTTEDGGGNGSDTPTTTDSVVSTTDSGGTNERCPENVAKECPAVDGEYPVYIPLPDCTKFCQCSNGLPWLHNCPDGLEFNPVLNVCDWPENAGCSSGNGTDSATTTDSNNDTETQTSSTTEDGGGNGSDTPTTTDSVVSTTDSGGTNERCPENVAKECPAVDGEYPVYIPLPDCTQFCQCSNGLPWLHNCPDGLEFNPVLNVCDWPENAGCSSGNGTDSATTTDSTDDTATQTSSTTEDGGGNGSDIPTTTESVVPTTDNGGTNERCPENVAKECPAVDGEYSVYIPLPDCTKFCQCSNGLPWLHNCPDGLEFNPVLNVCDWPENAGCSSGNGTDSATTTDSNDDTATQTSSTTEDSGGNGSDTPTTTESIVSTTDNGGTNERCPENIAKECPAVDGEYPVYIPLPDCTQFCQCSNGLPWLHNCPDGLEFNPVLNVCDWPENAGCSSGNGTDSATTTDSNDNTATQTSSTTEDGGGNGSDTPTTTESVVSTTDNGGTNERCPENVTKECPAVDGEYPVYIPLPDCTKFCQCSNGLPWLHNCPDGLEFNPVLNVCDWPENAGCSSGNGTDSATTTDSNDDTATQTSSTTEDGGGNGSDTPTTTESVVSTTDNGGTNERCPENVAKECPAVDGEYPVYIPLPDCTKFCQCSNGLPWLHNCPDGLEFNPVLNVCDWPENAGCSSGNGTDSATTTDSNDDTATQTSSTTEDGGGNGSDTPTTTDSVVSTTDSGGTNERCPENVAKECPAVDGEYPVYIPLPDCTKFCQCSNGLPWLHNCPDGLEFNPVLNVCDWPEKAGCSSGNGTDSATTTDSTDDTATQTSSTTEDGGGNGSDTPTTTESIVSTTDNGGTNERCPENVTKECPAVDGEYPVYIPLPDCTKFCQCSNGLPWLHNCPDGLEFNPVLNVCDWPENAGCSSGNGTDSATTTDSNDDTATQTSSTTEDGGGNGSDTPTTTESIVSTTDNDGTNERCPENVTKECPAVDGEYPVYIPLPDCTQFCQCSNGLPWLHNCPDGLEFNPVLNVCDWPENAGCSSGNGTDFATTTDSNDDTATQTSGTTEDGGGNGSDIPTTTESVVPTTDNGGTNERCPENVAKECPAVDGEHPVYIPLQNCTQFCQCSNGLAYLHNCPDNLQFNPVLNVCDWPESAGCLSGNASATTVTETVRTTSTVLTTHSSDNSNEDITTVGDLDLCQGYAASCPDVDGQLPVYIPLTNCTQFCQCSNGLIYLHNCPIGLHFNSILNVCDWPENARCSGIPS